jgi:hypothetical protein
VAAAFFARGLTGSMVLLAAISAGVFLATSPLVRVLHRTGMPTPVTDEAKITRVTFDRTVSDAWMPSGSFIDGKPHGFGIFERWVLRLGYFTSRGENDDALQGDLLVIANPGKPVTERFRQRLAKYVAAGGKLLVLDSSAYAGSTANDLLEPFEMSLVEEAGISGTLTNERGWPAVPVTRVKEVRGGTPFLFVAGKAAGSSATYGDGRVFVLGCGDRFSDANMGITGDTIPDAEMRKVYDLQFGMLRWMVEQK